MVDFQTVLPYFAAQKTVRKGNCQDAYAKCNSECVLCSNRTSDLITCYALLNIISKQ